MNLERKVQNETKIGSNASIRSGIEKVRTGYVSAGRPG
jgi:hypothetical protein